VNCYHVKDIHQVAPLLFNERSTIQLGLLRRTVVQPINANNE